MDAHGIEIVAADVGGTFTDVLLLRDDGAELSAKLPSTGPHYERAILDAVEELAGASHQTRDNRPRHIRRLAHGSTVGTNALLERKGANVGLVTTRGFRDVLELARLRRPSLFDTNHVKTDPLVPRNHRWEIDERMAADGEPIKPPSRSDCQGIAGWIVAENIEAVVISFLNAYANPGHEQAAGEWIREELEGRGTNIPIVLASDIQREIREFERTSTAAINAYVMPAVSEYLYNLSDTFGKLYGSKSIDIMQSNGSLIPSDVAARFPCRLIESGPAAGVLAAASAVAPFNGGNGIAFDMGGTTAKAALIEEGRPFEALQLEVGGAMNQSGAMLGGSGYLIRVSSLDISEVGAGGGSIVWVDDTGTPRVGPESAGAMPGPACYGQGGRKPTVTDANLLLGYLSPESIAGGRLRLHPDLAEKAISDHLAGPLGMTLEDTAWGVHELATATMEPAIRSISVEKGRDPQEYTLISYGGAGPMHATTLADVFGIRTVLVPPTPGLLCARGLMQAPIRHDVAVAYPPSQELRRDALAELKEEIDVLLAQHRAQFEGMGDNGQSEVMWEFTARYAGQPKELRLDFFPGRDLSAPSDEEVRDALETRFRSEHLKTYGYADARAPIEVTSIRARLAIFRPVETVQSEAPKDSEALPIQDARHVRRAYFGPDLGWREAEVHTDRRALASSWGPVILEEMDATTVVAPGWMTALTGVGDLVLTKDGE